MILGYTRGTVLAVHSGTEIVRARFAGMRHTRRGPMAALQVETDRGWGMTRLYATNRVKGCWVRVGKDATGMALDSRGRPLKGIVR